MKLFISCDMEGISGVVGSDDVDPSKDAYQRFRKIMTGDVNAAIEGAAMAGVDEVLVNDSHDGMRNILIEELHPKAQLVSGYTKPLSMMEGIDGSFDLAMFVGYHAMAGTAGAVMNHTFYGRMVDDVWINDKLVSEGGVNAGIAGYFDVPVGAVTGDDKIAKELSTLLIGIQTAVVKEGIDRFVARCLPLEQSRERIRNAAKRAVERRKELKPLKYPSPSTFKVRFASTSEAATTCLLPIVQMVDSRTVSVTQDDYLDAFKTFHAVLSLASTAQNPVFG
jgi:D-amino peptidase